MTSISDAPSSPARRSADAAGMPPEAIATYLRDRLEHDVIGEVIAYGQLTITVTPSAVPTAVQLCRDDPQLGFDFFDFLTAVDEREQGFGVVIHLYSTRHRHHVQIRALADGGRDDPRLPTITHLYRGADWHERETYDMFGITFEGHPGLLPRILTIENFEGFPLRKEFLLMSREVKPWPGLKEPTEVEAEDERDAGDETPSSGPSAEDKARMARERAERAKAKAAEARKRRAQERAGADGGSGLPPRGSGDEEPRALEGDGVETVSLVDEQEPSVGPPVADRPVPDPASGTDADDRRGLRDDDEDPT